MQTLQVKQQELGFSGLLPNEKESNSKISSPVPELHN